MSTATPFVLTLQIVERLDGIFIEAVLLNGVLFHDSGPFETVDEAKRAYDDLMDLILQLDGASRVITH